VPPPPPLKDEGSPATSALPAMALILALVGGLGGPVPAYAAFLTGTWAIRTGLSRRERIAATAGQALGAILVAVWGAGLAMTFRSEAI
ncbi:MAG: hypothetical protein N3A38_02930, partial [Planctomycetota bacterium]|nr:hypothetical protein [Planctomycetota bacterium]